MYSASSKNAIFLFAKFNSDNFTGSDYFTPQSYVRFNPGITFVSFYITTRDDRILEHDESFVIVAYPPSLPDGHNNCSTKVTIEDNDGKLVIKLLVVRT